MKFLNEFFIGLSVVIIFLILVTFSLLITNIVRRKLMVIFLYL